MRALNMDTYMHTLFMQIRKDIWFCWTFELENYKLIDLVIAVKHDMRVNKLSVHLRYQLIYML